MVYTLPWASGRVVLCHWSAQQLQRADKQSGRVTIKTLRKGCDVPEHLHQEHLSSAYFISLSVDVVVCLALAGWWAGLAHHRLPYHQNCRGNQSKRIQMKSIRQIQPFDRKHRSSREKVKVTSGDQHQQSSTVLFLLKIQKDRREKLKKPSREKYRFILYCHCKTNTTKLSFLFTFIFCIYTSLKTFFPYFYPLHNLYFWSNCNVT